jgi:hypothetical protein
MIFGLIGPVQALFCRKKKRKKQERKKQDEMTWRRESITSSFVLRHRRLKERRETEDLAEDDKVKASIAKAAVG